MRIAISILLSALLTQGCGGSGGDASTGEVDSSVSVAPMPLADVHFHARPDLYHEMALQAMDLNGVQWAGAGARGVDDLWKPYEKASPDRFLPFAGQWTILEEVQKNQVEAATLTSSTLTAYLSSLEAALLKGDFVGIGEIIVNNEQSGGATGDAPVKFKADCKLMKELVRIAGDCGVPLSVHVEADVDSLAEFRSLLEYNENYKKAKIIWAHAGEWIDTLSLDAMLTTYPNLMCDLSHRIRDLGNPLTGLVFNSLEEWKLLLENHSDRFLIGSDVNGDMSTYLVDFQATIDAYRTLLAQLSPAAAENIAYKNAKALFAIP